MEGRTDRFTTIEVPTKHEQVSIERVPVSDGTVTEAEIGEEEVVVGKRAVANEEVRGRKGVVEDTEVVEEDVRREVVDDEDDTSGRGR